LSLCKNTIDNYVNSNTFLACVRLSELAHYYEGMKNNLKSILKQTVVAKLLYNLSLSHN